MRGIYQSPSALLRVPCIIGVSFFATVIRCLDNIAVQSSSQRSLIEMSDPVERCRRTWPCCAYLERAGARGTVTLCVGVILWPFAASTVGVWVVGVICVHVVGAYIMSRGACVGDGM